MVSKVIIGNADVADVTVSDPQTIVLTGKSYGTTNLVILDQDGEAIVDERILVSVDEANTLRVFKQTARSVYSCYPVLRRACANSTCQSMTRLTEILLVDG